MLDKDLLEIVTHFGMFEQMEKEIEETNEYIEAKEQCMADAGESIDELIDEVADKIVLMLQWVVLYGGSVADVVSRVFYKVLRTKRRIKSGYYEKK